MNVLIATLLEQESPAGGRGHLFAKASERRRVPDADEFAASSRNPGRRAYLINR